jgi:hypothetical protein
LNTSFVNTVEKERKTFFCRNKIEDRDDGFLMYDMDACGSTVRVPGRIICIHTSTDLHSMLICIVVQYMQSPPLWQHFQIGAMSSHDFLLKMERSDAF